MSDCLIKRVLKCQMFCVGGYELPQFSAKNYCIATNQYCDKCTTIANSLL